MRPLWDIEAEVADVMNAVELETENGTASPETFERLSRLLAEERDKVDSVARFLRDLRHAEERCADEAFALRKRGEKFARIRARVSEVVLLAMDARGVRRLDGNYGSMRRADPPQHVELNDAVPLPEEFLRVVPAREEPDKEKIAAALREGRVVPGAALVGGKPYLKLWQ